MNKINVYYISIEGNTNHFLTKMEHDFKNLNLYRITDQSDDIQFKEPYFCFIPTYVKGTGNADPITEIDTLTMNEELGYKNNAKNCLGLIGSGNKNFGVDCYCWTARKYSAKYHIPVLDTYEITGTIADENRINDKMVKVWNRYNPKHPIAFNKQHQNNPLLHKLEYNYKHSKKYGPNMLKL